MKELIFVLAVVFGSVEFVEAEEIGRFMNNAGGGIVIDDAKCSNGGRLAYTYLPSGSVEYGCWFFQNSVFHVFWNNGEKRIYDLSGFNPSKKFQEQTKNSKVM